MEIRQFFSSFKESSFPFCDLSGPPYKSEISSASSSKKSSENNGFLTFVILNSPLIVLYSFIVSHFGIKKPFYLKIIGEFHIYFYLIQEYYNQQFRISKSLKSKYGTGEPFSWVIFIYPWGESLKGRATQGPNPTANLVSVYEKEGEACGSGSLMSTSLFYYDL